MEITPTTEQAIVDAFVALLNDIPEIVTACDGRGTQFNEAELPAANVFTPKAEGDEAGSLQVDHDLSVSIVLHVAERTAQKVIRSLTAKVYAAIGVAENNPAGILGIPQVKKIGEPAKAVKCIQQGDFIGNAQIALTVTYRTARWGM